MHPIIAKRAKKLGLDEFSDNSILMKTIQSFNDPNKILYSLPAPTYTSTEASTLKDQLRKKESFPDLKDNFGYRNPQFSGISEGTINDDDELNDRGNSYSKKHKLNMNGKEKSRKIISNNNKSEDYQSPYIHNHYNVRRGLTNKLKKNGSAGSVISAKKSVEDSETIGLIIRNHNNSSILDSVERPNELPMIDKVKSQESLKTDGVKINPNDQHKVKFTPERLRDRESKLSSGDNSSPNGVKQRIPKNEKYLQKALEPSEFKMRTEGDEYNSPTRRILESKKSRMQSNQSKDNTRNDSQSQLSQKKLQRNDSQKEFSGDSKILAVSDRNENSKSKRMIKNLREHIALKLYEHNVPTNNYHRVMGKASYNASSNSYIQKMLDAYNVFNYPESMSQKYSSKLK